MDSADNILHRVCAHGVISLNATSSADWKVAAHIRARNVNFHGANKPSRKLLGVNAKLMSG